MPKDIAIVTATFYRDLADRLIAGALAELQEDGIEKADRFEVPGAFELPQAAKVLVDSGKYSAVICLGAVIRGETDHYDYVCGQAAAGIQQLALNSGVPVSFGVLTVDNKEQALNRSGGDKRDSGRHAARAVLDVLRIAELVKA